MTIASATNRVDYVGDGATSSYSFTFKVFSQTDLLVTVRNTSNVETTYVLTTNYTVSLNADGSGSISLVAGNLTTDYVLTIRRVRTLTQTTDIRNQGSFFPETHENAFDHFIMVDQQQQDEIDRSIKLPETIASSDFSIELPATITAATAAGKALIVNEDSDGFILGTPAEVSLVDGSGNFLLLTGNMGIGEMSPLGKLHVKTADAGSFTPDSASDDLIIEGSTNPGICIVAPNNQSATLHMGDVDDIDGYYIQVNHSSDYMAFGVNAGERMRIISTGSIGIGETAPLGKLHVKTADAGAFTPDVAADDFIVEGAVNPGITIVSPNNQSCSLAFADVDDSDVAYIQYVHSTNSMLFATNTGERMRIDSAGNILIGGTSVGTSSTGNLHLFNGTAPTGSITDGVILYAEDVTSSSELKVRDEAGNVTTLSPHNFNGIPSGPSEDMAWSFRSEKSGRFINVDMLKAIRLIEKLSGETLVFQGAL